MRIGSYGRYAVGSSTGRSRRPINANGAGLFDQPRRTEIFRGSGLPKRDASARCY